ncbi:Homoserine O-acetyltransferase [Mycena sanguinolenta]|uniref:Homoserine O-acetyltransferase n=1 Tax=Mycena sanguinolenta TaxID=230812 RepID=A0A8H6Y2I8_9AGAR|nr:Homoserine O-acetyltransferase [Mycena sanguinolenta]
MVYPRCISWGEAQRQSIYTDPAYEDGFYITQSTSGLAAARMYALLISAIVIKYEAYPDYGKTSYLYIVRCTTYTIFYKVLRCSPQPAAGKRVLSAVVRVIYTSVRVTDIAFLHCHSAGSLSTLYSRLYSPVPTLLTSRSRVSIEIRFGRPVEAKALPQTTAPTTPGSPSLSPKSPEKAVAALHDGRHKTVPETTFFGPVQPACTQKLDMHDVARGRTTYPDDHEDCAEIPSILATLPPRALVISVTSDELFTPSEQHELAAHIPSAELVTIDSPDGHGGFLLEFAQINGQILRFLRRELQELYTDAEEDADLIANATTFEVKHTSIFGEAQADFTN